MQGFMPRFRRKIDRNSWVPIGEGSARTMVTNDSTPTSARLEGPPNFGEPVLPQLSPPPSYAQVQSGSRIQVAGLRVPHDPHSFASGPSSNAPRRGTAAPFVSSTVTSLGDIRQTDQHVQLDNRLSRVPSYPVLLEEDQTPRRQRSRRRSSIASTHTAGLMMAVGSLPGSELFDGNPMPALPTAEPHTVLGSEAPSSPMASPLSPLVSPLSAFQASVAKVMTVRRVNRSSTISSPPFHQASWSLDASTQGYYSPGLENKPFIKSSQTWPPTSLEERAARLREDPRMRFSKPREGARDINRPPTPPPKDPGYVARRPTKNPKGHYRGTVRKTHSSPNLLLFPRTENNNHGRTRSNGHQNPEWGNAAPTKAPVHRRYSTTRKPSQILDLCAKFIHKSIPRISVSA